uniref:Uncharacterized protein n=1 Tax=Rhodosorus marinus TaxID=101924 RepID=A0A7S3EDT5_9RHOD|mmetsp:Transcript_28015/g.110134  ORF Transcript_28015/g.110134 Transcript_28015/m.110134 type:complete len:136 (+) Transcript_28015:572-979(+)
MNSLLPRKNHQPPKRWNMMIASPKTRDKNQCKVESVSQSGLKQYNQGKRHNDGTACPKENVNGIEDSSAASSLPRVAYLTASEKKARKQFLRRRSSLKFDLEASLARPITWEMKTQTPEVSLLKIRAPHSRSAFN